MSRPARRGRWRLALVVGALSIAALVAPRIVPAPSLGGRATFSSAVFAENGELLRLTLAADQQYRLWVPLDQIAPATREAVLLYEDRWFFWHPGVNPYALARSAGAS